MLKINIDSNVLFKITRRNYETYRKFLRTTMQKFEMIPTEQTS